jgi:hypothetical protein
VKLNKKIIYVTHCCAKKDNYIKKIQERVTPDRLYVATTTERFMAAEKIADQIKKTPPMASPITAPNRKH